jgi:hypothetical protein
MGVVAYPERLGRSSDRVFEAVHFRFEIPSSVRLPPAGTLHEQGRVDVEVARKGRDACDVRITCRDGCESYARGEVLGMACTYLRAIAIERPTSIAAVLTPANGDAPVHYTITVGADVSISRTREAPFIG